MDGDIYFGSGADRYDGSRGGLVTGEIRCEANADIALPGVEAERIDGGAGIDTLDFSRAPSGIRLSLLAADEGSGWAAGDSYTGFENIYGSATGNDTLTGDGLGNILNGRGGVDVLSGGAGNDRLFGGIGADVLTGGTGNDWFYFRTLDECGDRIADFTNAGGNDDALRVSAAGFGGGLAAGALPGTAWWASTTGLAHDASDRLILRTTDKTLWFDADGTGAGARMLVADLNDNANVSAADILIY